MSQTEPDRLAWALVLASVLFSLLLGEVFARGWYWMRMGPEVVPSIYRTSEILPFELSPGAEETVTRPDEPDLFSDIKINSLGYRNREFEESKPEGTYRILVLGDSFILGWGVRQNAMVTHLLEESLQEEAGEHSVEVINAGFAAGYAPDTYYVYLKERGLALNPDLVVMAFLPRNDLEDIATRGVQELNSEGLPVRVRGRTEYVDEDNRRRQRTSFFYPRLVKLLKGAYGRLERIGDAPEPPEFMTEPYGPSYEQAWTLMERCVEGMQGLVRAEGAQFVSTVIPDALQVGREAWTLQGIPFDAEIYEAAVAQRRFARFAESIGLENLDLLSALRESSLDEAVYFERDGHWNALGHRVAAAQLHRFLVTNVMMERDDGRAERPSDAP